MVDNFEFSDTKQVRKTLLITSFVGICFKSLITNSTGEIEFLGFKIPISNASIIPDLIGYLIVYQIVVLIIRYLDEGAREKFKRYKKYLEDNPANKLNINADSSHVPRSLRPNYRNNYYIKKGVTFIDLIFPLLLGFYTLYKIFYLK